MKKSTLFIICLALIVFLAIYGCGGGGSSSSTPSVRVAQTGILTGNITKSSGSYSLRHQAAQVFIERAKVWLEENPLIFSFADESGTYTLTSVPAGNYNIVARAQEGNVIYKMREKAEIRANDTTKLNITIFEATNSVQGTLTKENGDYLPLGTILSLWGENFEVEKDGFFQTPPIPALDPIKAINEIVINPGKSNEVRLQAAFSSSIAPPELDLIVPASSKQANNVPSISLIAIQGNDLVTEVDPESIVTIRAVVFPANVLNENISWIVSSGSLSSSTVSIANTRELKWTSPSKGDKSTIEVSLKNNNYTAKAKLHIKVNAPATHKVLYHGNYNTSGEPPIDELEYIKGEEFEVLDIPKNFLKTGFNFLCWNTKIDGKGEDFLPGFFATMQTEDINLYAKWTQLPTFKVYYHGDKNTSGKPPEDPVAYKTGAEARILANSNNLHKNDHVFAGWNTLADLSGTTYQPDEKIKIFYDDCNLYAVWKPVFSITYYGNENTEGTPPIDENKYAEDDWVTLLDNYNQLAKSGHTFTGWNTELDGQGTTYQPNSRFKMPPINLKLYARWTKNPTFVVKYNGNGNTSGTPPEDLNTYEPQDSVTIKSNYDLLAKKAHRFIGWNTKPDGSGVRYLEASLISMPNYDIELFAEWIAVYSVTYDGNGFDFGSPPIDDSLYAEDEDFTVSDKNNLAKNSHIFIAWNTQPDGKGTEFSVNTTAKMFSEGIKLYAIWKPVYKVYYNSNESTSGEVPTDDGEYVTNSRATVKANTGNLKKDGFVFYLWNTAADASGQEFAPGSAVTLYNEDVHFYAQWITDPIIKNTDVLVKINKPLAGTSQPTLSELNAITNSSSFDITKLEYNEPLTQLGFFKANQVYSASITLTSKNNRMFSLVPFTPQIEDAVSVTLTTASDDKPGNSIKFVITWEKTAPLTLESIELVRQPFKLIYHEFTDNIFDLSGLIIKEIYNDKTSKTIELPDFNNKDYSFAPPQAIALTYQANNNTQPIITHIASNLSLTTDRLVVASPELLTSLNISVVKPVTGGVPSTLSDLQSLNRNSNFTITDFIWNEDFNSLDKFAASTAYTANFVVTASEQKMFTSDPFIPTIAGTAQVGKTSVSHVGLSNSVRFLASWQKTADLSLANIYVSEQPYTLSYTDPVSNILSLDGLVITEIYNDSTIKEVPFDSFELNGYQALPSHGAKLLGFANQPVTITHISSGKTAQTQSLNLTTIKKITAINLILEQPATGKHPQTLDSIISENENPDYSIVSFTINENLTSNERYKAAQSYSATLTLKSADDLMFDTTPFKPIVTDSAQVSQTSVPALSTGNSVTFIVKWSQTAPLALASLSVHQQPRLSYVEGEKLDLSSLVIKEEYNDSTYTSISFDRLPPNTYSFVPTNNSLLQNQNHNGQPVFVTHKTTNLTALTQNLIVSKPGQIAGVSFKMATPQIGDSPQTLQEIQSLNSHPDFDVVSIEWNSPFTADNCFKPGESYNTTVTLKSKNNKSFQIAPFKPHVEGSSSVSTTSPIGTGIGNSVSFVVYWKSIEALKVTELSIVAQPTKLSYSEDSQDRLELNGLIIKETYNDGSTEIIEFINGTALSYTSLPENGTLLTSQSHNNLPVKITHNLSGLSVFTQNLSVSPIIVEQINSITLTLVKPEAGNIPQTLEQVRSSNINDDFSIESIRLNETLTPENKYKAAVIYTLAIVLKASNKKEFSQTSFIPQIMSSTYVTPTLTSGTGVGNIVSFTVQWSQTADLTLKTFVISSQPTKLSYTETVDDVLSISGLEITETFNDFTTRLLSFDELPTNGYVTQPPNGATLTLANNNQPIRVTHISSALTANTELLTVNKAPVQVISALTINLATPTAGADPQSATTVQNENNHPDYNVDSLQFNEPLTPAGKFKAQQIYSATIVLQSKNNKKFSATPFVPNVPNSFYVSETTTEGSDTGNYLTFTITWNRTDFLTLQTIQISQQPNKLIYIEEADDILDLSGLIILETYNDLTVKSIEFTNNNPSYTCEPANATKLVASNHHNQAIKITHVATGKTVLTSKLSVTPQTFEEITSLTLLINKPKAGDSPQTLLDAQLKNSHPDYEIITIDWEGELTNSNLFKANRSYRTQVSLQSKNNKMFALNNVAVSVDSAQSVSQATTIGNKTGNTLSFYVLWQSTEPLALVSISISVQPTKLFYIEIDDDILALNGTEITETFNDLTTNKVKITGSMPTNYSSLPVIGSILKVALNDGRPVTISHSSGLSADTENLTVTTPALGVISEASLVLLPPVVGEHPQTLSSIQLQNQHSDYNVESVYLNESLTIEDRFKADSQYSHTITLKSKNNKEFQASPFTPIVQNSAFVSETQTSGTGTGNKLSFTITWHKTDPRTIKSIQIIQEPTKLTYTEVIDNIFSAQGLKILETYNDYTTDTVSFADYSLPGYHILPLHESFLTRAEHDQKPVTVTHNNSSLQAHTNSTLTVERQTMFAIESVYVLIEQPIAGAMPQTLTQIQDATDNPDYTVIGALWDQSFTPQTRFKAGTTYTTAITLKSKNNKTFYTNPFTPIVEGAKAISQTTTEGYGVGNTVSFIVTWHQTAPLTLDKLEVTSQPTKRTYIESVDDVLDFSGLVITELYNDLSQIVHDFSTSIPDGFTVQPLPGIKLTHSSHNNSTIIISHDSSGVSVSTDKLSVAPTPPEEIESIQVVMQAPKIKTAPQSESAVQTATNHPNYNVHSIQWNEEFTANNKFKAGLVYKSTITLKSKNGKAFPSSPILPVVEGSQHVSLTTTDGEEIGNITSFVVTWPSTDPLALESISLLEQPSKLTYTQKYDGVLTLNGLLIKLLYNDETFGSASFDNGTPSGFTTSPINGSNLTYSQHNNQQIKITHISTGLETFTNKLSVAPPPPEPITTIELVLNKPSVGQTPQDEAAINSTNPSPFFTVESIIWDGLFTPAYKFKAAQNYSSRIILKSINNYYFTSDAAPFVSGALNIEQVNMIGTEPGNKLSFVITWQQTEPLVLLEITLISQPSKLVYTQSEDDVLNLSGLQLREDYNDLTTVMVNFSLTTPQGYTTQPPSGTYLTRIIHHDIPISITHTASGKQLFTNNLVVNPSSIEEITYINLTLTPPTVGATPQSPQDAEANSQHPDYTIENLVWNGTFTPASKFKAAQIYTVTITLKSKNSKTFPALSFTPMVNGATQVTPTAVSGSGVGNRVTFEATWPQTEPLKLASIAVITQPKLTYTEIQDDILQLDGMQIRETYNDFSTQDVTFVNGMAPGYFTVPENGSVLTLNAHNGQTIEVNHIGTGEAAYTAPLQIEPPPPEEITSALVFIYAPVVGQIPQNSQDVQAQTNSQDFLVEEIEWVGQLTPTDYFAANTSYKTNVTLVSQNEKTFPQIPFLPEVYGSLSVSNAITQGTGVGNKLKFVVSWETTAPLALNRIVILSQPNVMEYFEGERLSLIGLQLREEYNDNSTREASFNTGFASGYTTSPVHNAILVSVADDQTSIVIIHNDSNLTLFSDKMTVKPVITPDPPQNVVAYSSASRQITVNWSVSANADSYSIYRSLSANSGYSEIANGITETTYSSTALIKGIRYYFKVKAHNRTKASDFSTTVSAIANINEQGPTYRGTSMLAINYSTNTTPQSTGVLPSPSPSPSPSIMMDMSQSPSEPMISQEQSYNEEPPSAEPINTIKYFNIHNFATNTTQSIRFQLVRIGSKVEIWSQYDNYQMAITSDNSGVMTDEFDNNIYDFVVQNFYTPSDIDNDGKIALFFYDITQSPASGYHVRSYFMPRDLHPSAANSNSREIIYLDTAPSLGPDPFNPDFSLIYPAVVHELQRLASYNKKVLEDNGTQMETWLDYAISMAGEYMYLNNTHLTSRISYFNTSAAIRDGRSLIYWEPVSNSLNDPNVQANFTLSYLFIHYLRTQIELAKGNPQHGIKIYKQMIEDSESGYKAVENLIQEHINAALTFAEFMKNFRIALVFREASGVYGFAGDPAFNTLTTPVFTGSSANIRGGGAVYKLMSAPFTEPAGKGPDIRFIGLFE